MKKKITDEQLIAHLEGQKDSALEQAILSDVELKQRYNELKEVLSIVEGASKVEVPAHISMNLQQAIHEEKQKQNKNFSWMQIAAAVSILILGFSLGKISSTSNTTELAALRSEIQGLKDVTLTGALQQYSASERIMAVNQIESVDRINPELIVTLINTLNTDESPNVRYAALQALTNYIDNTDVRSELVKSLDSQDDPLIQISLITILVEAEERSAIAPLKEIIENENIIPEVKQQAEVAIQVLT